MNRSNNFRRIGVTTSFFAFTSIVVFTLLSGCNGSNLEVGSKKIPVDQPEKPVAATSVTPTSPAIESSPANVATKLPAANAMPDVVCEKFLELLRSGNRMTAENLLTRSALAVTSRADLSIEPIGGEKAKYTFGLPMYATSKQKLAQVECKISDEIDGEAYETTLTWLTRKQKEGWRISGMIVQFEEDGPADLLSFENYADVLKIKGSLSGAEANVAQETQTSNSTLK